MAHQWTIGGEQYVLETLNNPGNLTEMAAPKVWTARKTATDDLIGYGATQAAAVADYKRTFRDRAYARPVRYDHPRYDHPRYDQ